MQIMRDPETGNSKGFAFINFASFEASDAAMEAMNGQYLCNRPITISYAFKKESKGERHGSAAGTSSTFKINVFYMHCSCTVPMKIFNCDFIFTSYTESKLVNVLALYTTFRSDEISF